MITPDRDQNDVVIAAGIRHHSGVRLSESSTGYLPGTEASGCHFISPRSVAEHRDRVSRRRQVGPIDRSDHARAHDEHLHFDSAEPQWLLSITILLHCDCELMGSCRTLR